MAGGVVTGIQILAAIVAKAQCQGCDYRTRALHTCMDGKRRCRYCCVSA